MNFVPTIANMQVLEYLIVNNYDKVLCSAEIARIHSDFLAEDWETLTDNAIRRALDDLCAVGFIQFGVKIGSRYTYFVTERGKQFYKYATTGEIPKKKK